MALGPQVPESDVLPPPQDERDVNLFNALRDYFLRNNDNLEWLIKLPVTSVSSDYTATSGDYTILVDATSANVTVTLPLASPNTGKIYVIKKIDSSGNSAIIDGNGSETVDGATTQSISTQYGANTIHSDGTSWHIISTK